MSGFGIAQHEIARMLDIDPKTLRRAFRRELDVGETEANVRVMAAVDANATKHNSLRAQIFWLKCRAGWREAQDINVNGTGNLHVDFRWADAPTPAPKPAPPTIEAEPEPAAAAGDAGGDVVVWSGNSP